MVTASDHRSVWVQVSEALIMLGPGAGDWSTFLDACHGRLSYRRHKREKHVELIMMKLRKMPSVISS